MMSHYRLRFKVKVIQILPAPDSVFWEGKKLAQLSQQVRHVSHIGKDYFRATEIRTAFITVPDKMNGRKVSKAAVTRKIRQFPTCGIAKILANHPILSEGNKYRINEGLLTVDRVANLQLVRYPNGNMILDSNGKPQYKRTVFMKRIKEDEDLRTSDPNDFFQFKENKE